MKAIASIVLLALFSATASATVTIDMVTVGNPGNAADTRYDPTGFGSVDHVYQIGKYEVTVGQYTAFLNAVAATDTYSLYNSSMATDLNVAGIAQTGSSPNFTYSVIGSPNHPITYVSWGDAARFANWLNNGQPTGAQDASTTEDGAYALNGAMTHAALIAVTRNAGARWFIPTEDEWYKAAYHKNNGPTGDYWTYPTRSENAPNSDQPPGDPSIQTNVANVYNELRGNGYNDGYAVTGSADPNLSSTQNYLTDVGAYTSSPSPYGTFDQGGNVWEWNETVVFSVVRGVRGGSFHYLSKFDLNAYERGFNDPTHEDDNEGFRVASIPEPSTAFLTFIACGAMCRWRKRTNA